jgi:hypothetical protein
MNEKIRILFLAANPQNVKQHLLLDKEIREIVDKINRGLHRDSLELVSEWSVQTENLQELLLRYQPHILHFSGHGQSDGSLVLENTSGNAALLNPSVFARLLTSLKDNLRVVLLNACYSKAQAQLLTETVDYTIGMNRPILDTAAKVFASYFYQALAFGRSVKTAFDLASIQLEMSDIAGSDTPELLKRKGVDESKPLLPDNKALEAEKPEDREEKKPQGKTVAGTVNFSGGTVNNSGHISGVEEVNN